MKIVNLDHFVLTVNNLQQSLNFYHKLIGLPVIEAQTNSSVVTLRCGHSLLKLRQLQNKVGAIVAKHLSAGDFDFCLESSQKPAEIVAEFEKKKIPIALGPVTKHGSKGKMTSVYVRDPDGNLVEISSYDNKK